MAAESRGGRFGTICVRVTALATVAVAVVLVVASDLLVARQRAGLLDQLDEALSTEAESLADILENGGAIPTLDDDDRIVVVIGSKGEVVATSGDADEIDSPLPSTDDEGRDISSMATPTESCPRPMSSPTAAREPFMSPERATTLTRAWPN